MEYFVPVQFTLAFNLISLALMKLYQSSDIGEIFEDFISIFVKTKPYYSFARSAKNASSLRKMCNFNSAW